MAENLWKADSFSGVQENCCLFKEHTAHYIVLKKKTVIGPSNEGRCPKYIALRPHLFHVYFNIILPFTLGYTKVSLVKNLNANLIYECVLQA